MLKWTVYGKKAVDNANKTLRIDPESTHPNQNCPNRPSRHSIEPNTVRKHRRQNKYQRRSLGSQTTKKSSINLVDKENVNYTGNDPNFYKEGLINKPKLETTALKDVSNITPTFLTPKTMLNSNHGMNSSREICSSSSRKIRNRNSECLSSPPLGTPITYSRRIREAKKRKLEMSYEHIKQDENSSEDDTKYPENKILIFNKNVNEYIKVQNRTELDDNIINKKVETNKRLERNTSEDEETEDSAICTSNGCNYNCKKSATRKDRPQKYFKTTGMSTLPTIEIQYSPETCLNGRQFQNITPSKIRDLERKSTLPIFGSRIFMENPLYFNYHDLPTDDLCKDIGARGVPSGDHETSFKSPSVAKRDVHSLMRNYSPISITPLSTRLSELRFSSEIKTKRKTSKISNLNDTQHPLTVTLLKDDEISTEMENKFILPSDSATVESESTISDSQMGDITLDRMIEDILQSTKKVKNNRMTLFFTHRQQMELKTNELLSNRYCNEIINLNRKDANKDAMHNSFSNTSSPQVTPKSSKSLGNDDFIKKIGLNSNVELNTSFIVTDSIGFNEREVRTPECQLSLSKTEGIATIMKKSCSINNDVTSNLSVVSESTPTTYVEGSDYRLKRQKCVRRKKSSASHNSSFKSIIQNKDKKLNMHSDKAISNSFSSDLGNISMCDPLSASFNCITGIPFNSNFDNINNGFKCPRNNSLIGLTLEDGIPSPATPATTKLKRPASNTSNDFPYKSSKQRLGNDDEPLTPLMEYKTSRRCLTYSPEDGNYSSAEKRRSVASSKSGRGSEKSFGIKGSIDLEIKCGINYISVHVIRCRDLQRASGKSEDVNAYAKVAITGTADYHLLGSQRAVFQRTSVLYARSAPEFQKRLELPLPAELNDGQDINISVWHRDKQYRRSEFLGCLSFPLNHAIKEDISGTFHLQAQTSTKTHTQQEPGTPSKTKDIQKQCERARRVTAPAMAAELDHAEDAACDEQARETGEKGGPAPQPEGVKLTASQQHKMLMQREADEHLFLRYLELDPLEGDPPPVGSARRASANRSGRTPFTTSRRLTRDASGGFGFTVVWTQPPRVERVLAGAPAERAGLRPGDYLVFVGPHNVVTAPEEEVRLLVKSCGNTLILETFRRSAQNGILPPTAPLTTTPINQQRQRGSTASHVTISDVAGSSVHALSRVGNLSSAITGIGSSALQPSESRVEFASNLGIQSSLVTSSTFRPGTACSGATTTHSLDINVNNPATMSSRRKLHLPHVTFSKETPAQNAEEQRKRVLFQVVTREQYYTTCLQFGLVRFVTPLAERSELITPADHQLLFQNLEEILRLSEDILDQVVQDDGEIQVSNVIAVYLQKTSTFISLYKRYCLGLKRADCVLVKKSRDPSGAFVKFCTSPPLPRRRPDITSLVHKPLEQFRELLRLMRTASSAGSTTSSGGSGMYNSPQQHLERKQLQAIAEQLQIGYQEVTAGSGLMGLAGDGKPLLSVADLESRLVFTRCKPFVLSTPGRQWIFGGELSRVEGRSVRPYWALLFSDLLLFAKVSRDRVLFITEEPVLLNTVSETCFSVRKKATEFRLVLGRVGNGGESPTVHCAPHVPSRARHIALRAPSVDLKAVWQSLLQRQIFRVHTLAGTPLGSPMESPDVQVGFSLATLDCQQRQTNQPYMSQSGMDSREGLVQQFAARATRSGAPRGAAMHLAQWMKLLPNTECEAPESDVETWSVEQLRRRSQQLNLLDVASVAEENTETKDNQSIEKAPVEAERSPSRSSNSDSQITVRTSPVVVDTIPVCRQCHKKCLSKPNSPLISHKDNKSPTNEISIRSPRKTSPNLSPYSQRSPKCESCIDKPQKPRTFKLERHGAIKIHDPPAEALKILDSIERHQRKLKSTSDIFNSPLLSTKISPKRDTNANEKATKYASSIRSNSPCNSSRNNSPLSTSHTTCSSMVFNSSANDLQLSSPLTKKGTQTNSSESPNSIQCVIAQEKYLSEVKCVKNVVLSKNKSSPKSSREKVTRQKAESVFNKVLGINIVTRREKVAACLKSSSVFLDDSSYHEEGENKPSGNSVNNSYRNNNNNEGDNLDSKLGKVKANGDVKKDSVEIENEDSRERNSDAGDDDFEWRPLMLMGLSAINPAAHLMKIDPFNKRCPSTDSPSRTVLPAVNKKNDVPNIAVVPPTPDYKNLSRDMSLTEDLLDDSPDSPQPEEPPYVSLKRYGTMSSLERIPSDETDDGNMRVSFSDETTKIFPTESTQNPAASGLMGWTARAGSFVAEKMAIFNSYADPQCVSKQASFFERYLGVGEWKADIKDDQNEGGDGSGASGEDAWGTPSSGDLSDNAFHDSDHGTLSSPTKSSSSYAGDDDTELMMDELLMTPTITGPSLRPLLPRRRLEPLLEEDCSDSDGSDDNKTLPATSSNQGSVARGPADGCCAARAAASAAPHTGSMLGGASWQRDVSRLRLKCAPPGPPHASPERTPTNEPPLSHLSLLGSKSWPEPRCADVGGGADASSTASTPSTLDRTAIHLSTESTTTVGIEAQPAIAPPMEERLSPRAEMRLALDKGRDMLAEQDARWGQTADPLWWRLAAQRSLLRRVASADAVVAPRTARDTTSHSSVYAWRENEKASEMERLAQGEVRSMRSRQRQPCQNGKILGFLRRRASSDSPDRRPWREPALLMGASQRPFSPRRQTDNQLERRLWKQIKRRRRSISASDNRLLSVDSLDSLKG